MLQLFKYTVIGSLIITLAACGAKNDSLSSKKASLDKLKKEQTAINEKIKVLESEIAKLDTAFVKNDIAKLVAISSITTQDFTHYIDLQGHIDADNISYISPRLGPGQVKAIYVKKGDFVKKGQLLLKLDDALIKQQINAAKQSLETIKTQLAFAKDIYNRQNNLWKQGIGTEVQLISARTNVETLEKQLSAAQENVKIIQEQASATNVYSDVDGIADEVNIRVGETFSGISATGAQIKIVNTSSLKVVTDVPENYAAKVRVGSKVIVTLPDLNKVYNSSISISGKTINPNNRSFIAEAKLPYDGVMRPNQNAQVRIEDYAAKNAITVPVNTIQTDEKGKFVFIAVEQNGKLIAQKKQIVVGELYNNLIEVKSGLQANEKLITEGFQNIYEGQLLKVNG
ncbi:MAG TPA: efflux RND transporter periplasmic adaptor subunit [Chitinophagaceae bacterium]|nr:efflux RND transporter periplasmic adaptor subunit [Chitinophagaceae bacterium]HNJ57580.1 efflux RND transporter periplasmic adaptor subunit [Chitinophagaceae bacterium]HNM33954.1 efflux RND transporter periplasmic adaptor subunit [Chitinophagaceae bacterium]